MKIKKVNLGDYVLASKWSDGKLGDPWAIGFVSEIGEVNGKPRYLIADIDGNLISRTMHRRAERISPTVGAELLILNKKHDWEFNCPMRSIWGMKRMVSAKAYKNKAKGQSVSKDV